MKRVWAHVVAGVSLLAGAGVVMPACAHDDSTLFVQGVLAPQLVSAGQQCVYTSSPTQAIISSGTLDVSLRNDYVAAILLGNQMVSEVNSQQLQTETSIISVQGAVVRVTDAEGHQLSTFTDPAVTTISPSTGGTPGYAPIFAEIVDPTSVSLAAVPPGGTVPVVTYVQFFGVSTGGDSEQSGEFEFPVTLCNGCLLAFSASDEEPDEPLPNCNKAIASASTNSSTSLPSPCLPGQDAVIDCSQCLSDPACTPNATATAVLDAGGGG